MINKKLLIIIGLIVVMSLAAGIVLLFGKKSEEPPATQPQMEISKLSDDEAISPISSFDGSAIWYFMTNGRLYRINTDGSGLSEFPLPSLNDEVTSVAWPMLGNDFIAISGSAASGTKNFYDSTRQIYISLPSNVQNFDWLPDGKRIAYIWKSGDNASQQLVMANADGSGFKMINNVFWPDLQVKASPLGREVLLVRTGIEGETNKIYRANLETGAFDVVVEEGKNLGVMWLPGGEKFIFAQASVTQTPRLFMFNFSNRQTVDLNINTTLDKVMIEKDGKYLYAAVPKKDNTGDEFVKVDLATFATETFFNPTQDIRAKNLIEAGNTIYFINTRDSKIYYISK